MKTATVIQEPKKFDCLSTVILQRLIIPIELP